MSEFKDWYVLDVHIGWSFYLCESAWLVLSTCSVVFLLVGRKINSPNLSNHSFTYTFCTITTSRGNHFGNLLLVRILSISSIQLTNTYIKTTIRTLLYFESVPLLFYVFQIAIVLLSVHLKDQLPLDNY